LTSPSCGEYSKSALKGFREKSNLDVIFVVLVYGGLTLREGLYIGEHVNKLGTFCILKVSHCLNWLRLYGVDLP